MTPASELQLSALSALKSLFVERHTPAPDGPSLEPAQLLAEIALLLSLPQPRTAGEADEQLAALQSSTLLPYAGTHAAWAYPVMARVQARVPDPAKIPDRQGSGAAWTPAAWRAYVALIL